jgi:two-component system response regulator RegX3
MRVLLVEDDDAVAGAITDGLGRAGFTVERVATGEAALSALPTDLVLLDLGLPDLDGLEVCRELRQRSSVAIIVITARSDELDRVMGLELGADDYVVKPFGHLALLARMKAVLRRAELPQPAQALPDFVAGDLAVNFQNHDVTVGGQSVKLTPVEYKLLYHLVRNAGRLMPHAALLDRVWGADYGATTDHLKVYVSRLRAKLEPDPNGPHYISTERGLGYRFVRPQSSAPSAEPTEPGQA